MSSQAWEPVRDADFTAHLQVSRYVPENENSKKKQKSIQRFFKATQIMNEMYWYILN